MKHGKVYLADLNPTRGSEQAGRRPVLVFQNDLISRFTRTVVCIPLTTNLRRAQLPSCLLIQPEKGDWHTTRCSCATSYGCWIKVDLSPDSAKYQIQSWSRLSAW